MQEINFKTSQTGGDYCDRCRGSGAYVVFGMPGPMVAHICDICQGYGIKLKGWTRVVYKNQENDDDVVSQNPQHVIRPSSEVQ